MASGHSSDSKKSKTVDLYHYTSKASAQKIMSSKVIKQSTGPGDVLLGEGTYFTTLSPHEGKDYIKQNNWDDNSLAIPDKKVQAAVKVSFPRDEVRGHTTGDGREIYVKPGDVDLTKYSHQAYDIKWRN